MSAATLRDIALDTNGDIDVSGQDLKLTSGVQAVQQAVRIRLLFFQGEWFLDTTEGTAWLQDIFVKNPDVNVMQSIFADRIKGTPGIKSLDTLALTYDRPNRKLSIVFGATCDFGQFDDVVELSA